MIVPWHIDHQGVNDLVQCQYHPKNLVAYAVNAHGGVNFGHNNAAIRQTGEPLHDLPEDTWDRILDTNLKGAWLVLKHALIAMREQQRGVVINTASIAASQAFEGGAAYNSSKAGLVMLTKIAALENAAYGIRVNAVAPGLIATPMTSQFRESPPTLPGCGPTGPTGRDR